MTADHAAAGRQLRDAGIEQVLENESDHWKAEYLAIIERWFGNRPSGHLFTGETLRQVAQHVGLREPHHHNSWSGNAAGLVRRWLKSGAIVATGQLVAASKPKTHAHALRQYRKA